ncbi:unnamed protein product [Anisakis simplex]|uniref:Proteasome assembly chaperone 2 n=1 Tax=Anisakis simplex TaxID=6269 RepID=A0A0M3K1S3_ANISI|nr:unnamed protein product [Anisakis simplex]
MAICIALIGKDSSPLFVSICEKDMPREFDVHMFLYCSLDIVDEKVDGSNRPQELYLGPLISDQKFKSFGYVTNTNVKIILITEVGNSTLKDQDVRSVCFSSGFDGDIIGLSENLSNSILKCSFSFDCRILEEVAQDIFIR